MNRLEQQIFDEFDRFETFSQYITKQDGARIAARIALELAEKGYKEGHSRGTMDMGEDFDQFKQEVL